MSIILDALKRAESLRKKNQPPNLMSGVAPLQPGNRRVILLGVVFVLAGLGAWFWRPAATVNDVRPMQAESTESGSAGVQLAQTDANTPAGIIEEGPVLENEPVHQTQISSGASQVSSTTVPVLNQTLTQPAMLQASSQPEALAPQQAITRVESPNKAVNPLVNEPKVVEAETPSAMVPVAIEAPPAETPSTALPTIFELDYPIRLALPKMLVSMYVYNSNPEFRFLIVNGKKVRQGEQVEASVTFAEIRRDGVECEYQGTRFFFPRNSQ